MEAVGCGAPQSRLAETIRAACSPIPLILGYPYQAHFATPYFPRPCLDRSLGLRPFPFRRLRLRPLPDQPLVVLHARWVAMRPLRLFSKMEMPHKFAALDAFASADCRPPFQTRVTKAWQCGTWQCHQHLGSGTFCDVWSASPMDGTNETRHDYAVKVIKPEFQSHPGVVRQMQREVALGQTVSHPHLVPVFDAHVESGTASYLVMPHLRGGIVRDALQAVNRFSPPHAVWIARQVLEAITPLHQSGWLHGDIKPDNIHVSPQGHVTLIDLGFARRFSSESIPSDESFPGTPQYSSPETLISHRYADGRSDIYSLGATLFEMLTGTPPFEADSPQALIEAQITKPAPSVRERVPDAPVSADNLLREMLAKLPVRRPFPHQDLRRRLLCIEIELFAARPTLPGPRETMHHTTRQRHGTQHRSVDNPAGIAAPHILTPR